MPPKNLVLRISLGNRIVFYVIDIFVLSLCVILALDQNTSTSDKWIIFLVIMIPLCVMNWGVFRVKLSLKDGILNYADEVKSKGWAVLSKLPTTDIQAVYVGTRSFLGKSLGQPQSTAGAIGSVVATGLLSSAAAGGEAADMVTPYMILVQKNGAMSMTSVKPYSAKDINLLLYEIKLAGAQIHVQPWLVKHGYYGEADKATS